MTRSVTIVNTSNWEHEDVEVLPMYDNKGDAEKVTLKPGDSLSIGPYTNGQLVRVRLQAVQPAEPVPFRDADGKQDLPRVDIHKPVQHQKGE